MDYYFSISPSLYSSHQFFMPVRFRWDVARAFNWLFFGGDAERTCLLPFAGSDGRLACCYAGGNSSLLAIFCLFINVSPCAFQTLY